LRFCKLESTQFCHFGSIGIKLDHKITPKHSRKLYNDATSPFTIMKSSYSSGQKHEHNRVLMQSTEGKCIAFPLPQITLSSRIINCLTICFYQHLDVHALLVSLITQQNWGNKREPCTIPSSNIC